MNKKIGESYPNELVLEIAQWVLEHQIELHFGRFVPPVDACVLRAMPDPNDAVDATDSEDLDAQRDVDVMADRILLDQARCDRVLSPRAAMLTYYHDVRIMAAVCKLWRDVILSFLPGAFPRDPKKKLLPPHVLIPHQAPRSSGPSDKILVLDGLTAQGFGELDFKWIGDSTHLSLSTLPSFSSATRCTMISQDLQSAPRLTHLTLRGTEPPTTYLIRDSPVVLENLTFVRLVNSDFVIAGRNITSMTIVGFFTGTISTSLVLDTLSKSPNLRLFHLRLSRVAIGDEDVVTRETLTKATKSMVCLKHLRHLVLCSEFTAIFRLLASLELGPDTHMHLEGVFNQHTWDGVDTRILVPFLFTPERLMVTAEALLPNITFSIFRGSGYAGPDQSLSELVGEMIYPPTCYPYVGISVGCDRSRPVSQDLRKSGPEIIHVVFAATAEEALLCLSSGTAHGAELCEEGSERDAPPPRSITSRMLARTRRALNALQPRIMGGTGNDFHLDIKPVMVPLDKWGLLPANPTMIIGPNSYCPQSPSEWHSWLRTLRPSVLIITRGSFEHGYETTARGDKNLRALAAYLKGGYTVRYPVKEKCFDTTLTRVEVSRGVLGENHANMLLILAQGSGGKGRTGHRRKDPVQWCLYND